jgi:hypothetical protein
MEVDLGHVPPSDGVGLGPVMMNEVPLSLTGAGAAFIAKPSFMVSWPTFCSSVAILASYSATKEASASSLLSSPRSYWPSQSCSRVMDRLWCLAASRRPMAPLRMFWQS